MKNKKVIHAIHSIKGGSGKSTFAFTLAIKLSKNRNEKTKTKKSESNVLLIDADFRGTSLQSLFFNYTGKIYSLDDKEYGFCLMDSVEKKNFNDYFKGETTNLNDYISHCMVKNYVKVSDEDTQDFYNNFNIIFSSRKYTDKKPFLYSKNMKSTEKISVEYFKEQFKNFCYKLTLSNRNTEYNHIIFDLSPNSDEYTDTILKTLSHDTDDKIDFYHYIVTLNDSSHLDATVEYIHELTCGELRHKNKGNIVVVLNQNCSKETLIKTLPNGVLENEAFDYYKNLFKEKLTRKGINDATIKKIKYLYLPFNEFFFIFSRNQEINNENMNFDINGFTEMDFFKEVSK